MASSSSSSTRYGAASEQTSRRGGSSLAVLASSYKSSPPLAGPADGTAPFVAEFLGTFVLVFTIGCLALAPGSPTWTPVAIGCVMMSATYATYPISGGNLNPAVSFSAGLVGHLRWTVVVRYWMCQLAAGTVASFCLRALFAPDRLPGVAPVPPFTWEYAVAAEVIYTFLLCFVWNNCAASKRNNPKDDNNHFYALAIGCVELAGGFAVSRISGAAFNPAVAVGFSYGNNFRWAFAWLVAELVGATLAAINFRAVRPEEYNPPEGLYLTDYEPKLHVRCASEFLGTFVLVLTVGLNLTMGLRAASFSSAAALMCMTYSLGNVSGAHFNPAVTLAVVLSGRDKCLPADGAAYVICQVMSGACAGVLYSQFHAAGPSTGLTFALQPGDGYGPNSAGVVEMFFTFVLAYAFLACATVGAPGSWRTTQRFYTALAIGSCVTAGGFAVGRISGGELNPAVSVGVASANLAHWGRRPPPPFASCIVYSLWQLTGGLLASVVFSLTHPDEYKKEPLLAK